MSKPQGKQPQTGAGLNKKNILLISVAACIFIILLAVMLAHFGFFTMVGGFFIPRGEVQQGTLPISDGLDKIKNIPKGEVRYRINKSVTFENSYAKGDIMLEDPAASEYDMRFTFYSEKDKALIYKSPKLKPGEFLNGDKLKKKLKRGEYKCVYNVDAYDSKGVLKGQYGGYLTITVEN